MKLKAGGKGRIKGQGFFAALYCGLLALFLLGAPAGAVETAKTSGPPVLSASEIDYPPFCMVDAEGRAGGFSVDLMRAALAAMGRDVVFRTGPWAEVRGWLETGEVQALPLVGRTPEREALFDFTFPYMSLHGAIVVRQDTDDITGLNDLKGRRVAVMKGDNAEEFLRRKDRGIAIHTTSTFEQAFRELSLGRHDAVVIQRLVALRLIQETGLKNLRVLSKPIEDFRQDFCFAVKKGDSKTLALLNEGLALVMADGTYRHLHAKWFAALELPTNRRIIIGGDHNYPPYEYLDENGRPTGYNVDLTKAIARALDLDIEIRLGPWAKIRQALADGEIDAIQGMLYSPERDLIFNFTPAHTVNHYVAVVRKGEGDPPSSAADLAGRRIVVQDGDIMHDFVLEKGMELNVFTSDSQELALKELAEGRHDCALAARLTAMHWKNKYGWDNLVVGSQALFSTEYCYAVHKNQRALLAQLAEGLKIIEDTGEYRHIYEEWMGVYEDAPLDSIRIIRYVAMVAVPLLLIIIGAFAWSWSLRRQVARQTEKLRQSAEFQRAMIACSPVALYSLDPDGRVSVWNASAKRIFGWTAEEVMGRPLPIVPEDKRQEFIDLRKRVMNGESFSRIEVVRLKKNGFVFDASLSASPIHDSEGNIIGIMSSVEDISERKRSEAALKKSEEQYRLLADNTIDAIWTMDMDLVFTYVNPACFAMAGYTPEEWIGSRLQDHCDEKNFAIMAANVMEGLEGGPEFPGVIFEAVMLKKNREPFPVEIHGKIIYDAGNNPLMIQGVTRDISERRHAEEVREKLQSQLLQSQKMESVGRLAGGVAHDFNNMLTVILGYTEMAMDQVNKTDPIHADLEEVRRAGKRSMDITGQLLAFARKQVISPRVMDLNETVEGMLKMLRRLIGEDIDLEWHPEARLWPVKMDPAQINQMLANLCVNARDAISGVGKMTIETENIVFDADYCADHAGFIPGDFVMLAVSDNGCGMDGETLNNIFEPFFTTKEVGKGTGLGLATIYGIVKQNSGFINVYSEPGKGTTFRIYLPRHAGEAKEATAPVVAQLMPGRGETVLLVEDEPTIMTMGKVMLEKLGYQVLAAATPGEAMSLASEYGETIHLLITDVVMPEMNGRDLANLLRTIRPDIRVVFMSGYTANVIAHHGVLDAGVHFIQKPFSMQELSVQIRAAIGA
ncbi:MAG: PAS domain S-box protein [Desulfobacteraceae bacterium]|nr:MAG: PAS domain S-box protein [Desulfobacteraceae bacterium]